MYLDGTKPGVSPCRCEERLRLPHSALPGDGRQRHGGPGGGRERAVGHHGHEGEQQHPRHEDLRLQHGADLRLEHHPQPQPGGGHVHGVRGPLRRGQHRGQGHQDPAGAGPVHPPDAGDRAALHQPLPPHHHAGLQPQEGPAGQHQAARRLPLHLGRRQPADLPGQVSRHRIQGAASSSDGATGDRSLH